MKILFGTLKVWKLVQYPHVFEFHLMSLLLFFPLSLLLGRFPLSSSSAFCCIFFSSFFMFCFSMFWFLIHFFLFSAFSSSSPFSSYPVSRMSGLCLWWLSVPLMVVWPFRPFRLLRAIHLCLRLRLHRCLCVCCCPAASIRRFRRHLSAGSICRFSAAIQLLRSLFSH